MEATYNSDYVSISNNYDYCCWELEKAFFGVAWEFRELDAGEPNCFGYALGLDYTPSPQLHMNYGDSVYTVATRVEEYLTNRLGRNIRRISGPTDLINSNEYRFCMRVRNKNFYDYDYHFWLQTNTGAWCEKNGKLPVLRQPLYANPTTVTWDVPKVVSGDEVTEWYTNYYDSDTVYFAATLS